MKKILLFVLLGLAVAARAQNAFYDAKMLYELDVAELDTLDLYKDLLVLQADREDWRNLKNFATDPLRYIADEGPRFNARIISKLQSLKQQYRINYDRGKIRYERKFSTVFDLADNAPQGPLDDIASGLVDIVFGAGAGGSIGTRLTDATSTLLLSRTEAELTLSFLGRLRDELENRPFFIFSENGWNQLQTDTFYLRNIFPGVYALIADYEQGRAINIGKSLQNAFEEDLKNFYANAQRYLTPASLRENLMYHTFSVVHQSFQNLSKGMHPSLIISSLAEQYAIPEGLVIRNPIDSFKCAIQLVNGVAQSLQDASPARTWIRLSDWNKLNPREMEYYIGLFYLEYRLILRKTGITGARFLQGERSADFVRLQKLVGQTLAFLEQVELKMAELRLINATRTGRLPGTTETQTFAVIGNNDRDRQRAFYEYAFVFSGVIEQINAYACWTNRQSVLCSETFQQQYLPVARELLQVPLHVENKEYAAAFLKTLQAVETLHRNNSLYQTPYGLVRYLSLAADIVAADSADQIRRILNDVILPVGSYRIKRYAGSSVFIGALVGAGTGAEWLDNASLPDKWALHVSPMAPIGIDFSWGSRQLLHHKGYTTRGTSNGLFLSVIDVGGIISYRFQTSSSGQSLNSSNLPTIKLEQLLSPGLFYTHGFRNSPILWGVGVQLTPKLRDIKDQKDLLVDRANAFRFSTFLAVDLPMFTLSAKNDRRPRFDSRVAERQLREVTLRRELDVLMRDMLRAGSSEERRRLQTEIDRREKELRKIQK